MDSFEKYVDAVASTRSESDDMREVRGWYLILVLIVECVWMVCMDSVVVWRGACEVFVDWFGSVWLGVPTR